MTRIQYWDKETGHVIISGFERVAAGIPESPEDARRRTTLADILRLALTELDEGRDPQVVAQALRNALVNA